MAKNKNKRYTFIHMREQPTQHFVGLDIGTSAVRCIVGTADPTDPSRPAIIGHGFSENKGMRKGVVAHPDDVTDAVINAVKEAERVSGFEIKSATVNVNGTHVKGINSKGVIAISTANREISNEDRNRVEEAATIVSLPPNKEIIQVFAKNYRIDGQDNIKDPVGMHGVRLEVDTHIVTATTPYVSALHEVLNEAKIIPSHQTVSSLAAAEAVLTRQQKEAGTLVVDIGAGTTNIVVIEDGEVQHIGVIPVGGMHLTNDLAIGLKTDLDVAEKVKLEHAKLNHDSKVKTIKTTINKTSHSFDSEEIYMITEARMEELFELIDKELKKIHKSGRLPGGVVLVGGVANLPGIDDFAKDKLQLAARVGKMQPIGGLIDTVSDLSFRTSIGLMLLDMFLIPSASDKGYHSSNNEKVFGLLEGTWKKIKSQISK